MHGAIWTKPKSASLPCLNWMFSQSKLLGVQRGEEGQGRGRKLGGRGREEVRGEREGSGEFVSRSVHYANILRSTVLNFTFSHLQTLSIYILWLMFILKGQETVETKVL